VRSNGCAGRGIPLRREGEPAALGGECRRRAPTILGVQRTAPRLNEAARALSGGRREAGDPFSRPCDRRRRETGGRHATARPPRQRKRIPTSVQRMAPHGAHELQPAFMSWNGCSWGGESPGLRPQPDQLLRYFKPGTEAKLAHDAPLSRRRSDSVDLSGEVRHPTPLRHHKGAANHRTPIRRRRIEFNTALHADVGRPGCGLCQTNYLETPSQSPKISNFPTS